MEKKTKEGRHDDGNEIVLWYWQALLESGLGLLNGCS